MPEQRGQLSADDFTTADPPAGTYLGFDFGLKRIGVASGNSATQTAMPLETVSNHNGTPDWDRIDNIIAQWQPVAVVVGIPVKIDGSVQDITHHAAGFKRRLARRYSLPALPADERHSSIEAAAVIKNNRHLRASSRANAADVDKIAACRILQNWLEAHFQQAN